MNTRGSYLAALIAAMALVCAPGGAPAEFVPPDMFEIDSELPAQSDIPIIPCVPVNIVAHLSGPEPEYHIHDVSMKFWSVDATGQPIGDEVLIEVVEPETFPPDPYVVDLPIPAPPVMLEWGFDPRVEPCNLMPVCTWVPWGTLHVIQGQYCQRFSIQADISFDDGTTLWSNILTFHVIPEPATLSMLALGGLALIRRRRR